MSVGRKILDLLDGCLFTAQHYVSRAEEVKVRDPNQFMMFIKDRLRMAVADLLVQRAMKTQRIEDNVELLSIYRVRGYFLSEDQMNTLIRLIREDAVEALMIDRVIGNGATNV